jgi:uncharacterized protein with von Willebrand factor type A (vWA) domain
MSARYAEQMNSGRNISTDFQDPCMRSVSGHITPMSGIIRDMVFRLKGTSVTLKRDVWVCDALDNIVDVMLGAQFIKEQFHLLFSRVKEFATSLFAGWFSSRKESREEKEERESRERKQRLEANARELARLKNERQQLEAAEAASRLKAAGVTPV